MQHWRQKLVYLRLTWRAVHIWQYPIYVSIHKGKWAANLTIQSYKYLAKLFMLIKTRLGRTVGRIRSDRFGGEFLVSFSKCPRGLGFGGRHVFALPALPGFSGKRERRQTSYVLRNLRLRNYLLGTLLRYTRWYRAQSESVRHCQ